MVRMMSMKKRDLVSIDDINKDEIIEILEMAAFFKQQPNQNIFSSKVMASCFFEPSTRTRLSFETAMLRLGGKVMGFSESITTSSAKGESLSDSMRVIGSYADVIVIRHQEKGAAQNAAEASSTPVINAGDGDGEHPTQTLVDLFTIKELFGDIDGKNIIIAGDLRYGRTTHSLAKALRKFAVTLYFVSPSELSMPDEVKTILKGEQIAFTEHRSLEEVIGKGHVLYMTRLQKERMAADAEVDVDIQINLSTLMKANDNLKIFHPLPRLQEIDNEVDRTHFAAYFMQAENGVCVRQAILKFFST